MKKVTDEEVQRAVDRWYDTSASIGEILEEFIANREKEEVSEPTAPTITISHGAMTGCTQDAIDQASESKVCEYCGPKCYGGAAHNERVENGDRYTDATQATQDAEPKWKRNEGDYPHKLICNGDRRYPAGTGHCCSCFNTIPSDAIWGVEHKRLMAEKDAEHKAKMREAIEYTARAFSPSDVLALPEWGSAVRNICAHYGLTEPTKTPEERVTTEYTGEEWRVFLDGEPAMYFHKVDYSQEVAEYARVGLIAKLKEEAK